MSIIEISELGCHLARYRGFLTLSIKAEEIRRIPLDQITSIITKAHGITYTHSLLITLGEYKIPLLLVDKSFKPVSLLLPIESHHKQSEIIKAQTVHYCKVDLNNQLWQKIVINKIQQQAQTLKSVGQDPDKLLAIAKTINRGDSRNGEAQAARLYFKILFGDDFLREKSGHTPNELLNYGYTIMRSAIARYVCSAGLIPALGIHHCNQYNAFCLVDDLIEPYRAVVDLAVYQLLMVGEHELDSHTKKVLVGLLQVSLKVGERWETVEESMKILSLSLNQSYRKSKSQLKLPKANQQRMLLEIKRLIAERE